MAKVIKIKELPELNLDQVNMYHILESYRRQVSHAKPVTAKKKSKSDVRATSAKWFRQKGTGRARQGERTNPHLYGGGLAFPPHPHKRKKGLNKQVRISAVRSAVLAHLDAGSLFYIQGKEFDSLAKTKEIAQVLGKVEGTGDVCLVLTPGSNAWRSSRNLPMVRLIGPEHLNVRDLVDSGSVVFAKSALDVYKELLKAKNIPPDDVEDAAAAGPEEVPLEATEEGGEE